MEKPQPMAGIGFALMAVALANERSWRGVLITAPYPRGHWTDRVGYPTGEYYRIIDKADEAWRAFPGSLPMHPRARMVL